ncbi:hypothetical protein GCM10007874_15490 [Labrys miyagiensis]|uniref:Xylulose 5-phosphate/Fructose 6-phosphate phosphoketolase N-terminal domain-containing protein n=1 Tax=Labrys miyagiensis TaxID=346912 RepID=A0ABQ6CFW9_9HYPH|nr:hypothetical protein GCM10007874_15490 [Labrys miyagiensis]
MAASQTLDHTELDLIERYWRAANYLSVGQIYLYDNPLLKRPLAALARALALDPKSCSWTSRPPVSTP